MADNELRLQSQVLIWDSSSIWRVDPSGQFWKCRAAVIGRSRHRLEEILVEGWKDNMSEQEAIRLAVSCIHAVIPKNRHLYGVITEKDKQKARSITTKMLLSQMEGTVD
jgi:20S proteasome alpha/beta subunit